jgi:hypothetical protein
MIIVFIYLGLAFLAGFMAKAKGAEFFKYFVLSLGIPGLALIEAAFAKPEEIGPGEGRRCSSCEEIIRVDAEKCKFCGASQNQID